MGRTSQQLLWMDTFAHYLAIIPKSLKVQLVSIKTMLNFFEHHTSSCAADPLLPQESPLAVPVMVGVKEKPNLTKVRTNWVMLAS